MTRNSSIEAEIRAVIEGQAQAIREKNARAAVAPYVADTVIFDLVPPLLNPNAGAALERSIADWFATWQGPIGYELRDVAIMATGELAFAHGFVHIAGHKADGAQDDLWFRQTLCFRKIDGAWRIVHDHASVPFYMDGSYRAAIDLKP